MNWVSGTFSSSTVYQYYPFDYHLLNQYQYKVCKHVATISYFLQPMVHMLFLNAFIVVCL